MRGGERRALQRGPDDSVAGQQNMHGLVDSSDSEMELAETKEVTVSEKGCFWVGNTTVGGERMTVFGGNAPFL